MGNANKPQKKNGLLIVAVSVLIVAALLLMLYFLIMGRFPTGDHIIATVLILAFLALMIFIAYKGYKKSSAGAKTKVNDKERFGATMNATLKHTEGLPIANGVPVEVFYGPDKFVFKKDNQEISVSRDKITSVDCVTGKDLKGQAAAGAVAGKYILGGMTGAVIGSLVATTTYLTISYVSGGENKFIVLDTYMSGTFALKVQKDFKQNNNAPTNSIEL